MEYLIKKRVWFKVELHGAQGDRKAEVFQRSIQQCTKSGVAKHLCVAVIQQQNRLVKETNVTLLAKKNIDHGAGLQEVQTQDLMDYQLARDREKHLACELFGYREDSNGSAFAVTAARLKDDMDARPNVYVLSNGCRKYSDDRDGYYWRHTPGLLDKAKRNVLGMEIIKDQSGNTLRVSQSSVHDTTEAAKKKIWPKGLLTESKYELRLVAGIANGTLVKGGSRSEVSTQVEVAAYWY
nr:zinc finger, CCHC-type [Tanacetum cinerariifolium]